MPRADARDRARTAIRLRPAGFGRGPSRDMDAAAGASRDGFTASRPGSGRPERQRALARIRARVCVRRDSALEPERAQRREVRLAELLEDRARAASRSSSGSARAIDRRQDLDADRARPRHIAPLGIERRAP